MNAPIAADRIAIRRIPPAEAAERIDELAAILVDVVANGASVNFLAGFSHPDARAFWQGQLDGLRSGEKRLFVAEDGGRLVGTTLLMFAPQPNAPHRAEIGKMLVHSGWRRRGLGRRLLAAAEADALGSGRTLLLLDTESGSAGEGLYASCGWMEYGRVPGHALRPHGEPAETTMFYKRLG